MEIPVALTVCSFSAGGDLTLWCCPPLYAPHSAHTATRTLGISVRFACCARLPPSLLTLFVQSLHGPVIQELTGSVEGVESQSMHGGRESGNGLVAVTAWWPKPAEALLDFEVYFIFFTLKFKHICSWTSSYQNHVIQVPKMIPWESSHER